MAQCDGNGIAHSGARKHALVIPMAIYSHIAGLYPLAVQLAKLGVSITFVTLADEVSRWKSYQDLDGLDFNFMPYDPGFKQGVQKSFQDAKDYINRQRLHFQPLLAEIKSRRGEGRAGPTCIISDFLLGWSMDVGVELNLPVYEFYITGQHLSRLYQEIPGLIPEGFRGSGLPHFDGSLTLPGLPPLLYQDLPMTVTMALPMVLAKAQSLANLRGLIVNTVYEIETKQVDETRGHFERNAKAGNVPKVFTVGPLAEQIKSVQGKTSTENGVEKEVTPEWLNTRPANSVLYICRGTLYPWTDTDVHELALALESSGQSFLWVLRPGPNLPNPKEALPAGFEERTKDQGLIVVGWVPQTKILAHASVEGFLCQCGWNSCLESMGAGVPVLGWPQGAEQFLSCRHLAETLKIGVQIGHGKEVIGHEEIEIALGVFAREVEAMRQRAQMFKVSAREAVAEGGSSYLALRELAESIPGDKNR